MAEREGEQVVGGGRDQCEAVEFAVGGRILSRRCCGDARGIALGKNSVMGGVVDSRGCMGG